MSKVLKITLIIAISIITTLILCYFSIYHHGRTSGTISGKKLELKIAKNSFQRKIGLSWHKELKANEGMLFVFDKEERRGVWMKGMNFPIDVVWLDEKKKVADFKKNLKPDSYPKTYYPSQKIKYFLEVEAGFVEKYNVKLNDQLNLH